MTSPIKILLTGFSVSSSNMGVKALTSGAVTLLHKLDPEPSISFLEYSKIKGDYTLNLNDHNYLFNVIDLRFSYKFWLKNNAFVLLFLSVLIYLFHNKSLDKLIHKRYPHLSVIADNDLVFAISGGDSFSDIYGLSRLLYVSLPQLLAIFLKKKLIQLPQTYGPFKRRSSRMLARFILKRSSLIFSRDKDSIKVVSELIGKEPSDTKTHLCHDLGFILSPKPVAHRYFPDFSDNEPTSTPLKIGINPSGLLYSGGYTRNNMFDLKIDYTSFIHDLIRYLLNRYNCKILLVPHVLGDPKSLENDSSAADHILNSLEGLQIENVTKVEQQLDQSELKYIIGKCDFFIGSRMHACIAALSQSVPTVAISYSKKFNGVFQLINMENLVADPTSASEQDILSIIDKAISERLQIRDALEREIPAAQTNIFNLIPMLENIC